MQHKLVEHLVSALRELPKEDRSSAIPLLMADEILRPGISKWLIDRLSESKDTVSSIVKVTATPLSPQELARQERRKYVSDLKNEGIDIAYTGKIWAKTPSGLWVALPFANENQKQSDRWFLGVGFTDLREKKEQGKVVIIMLCRSRAGNRLDFVIPPLKAEEIIPYLGVVGGQYKINLKKTGSRYSLLLPGANPVDVTDYRSQTSVLQN